jgi:copper(I)-binding protein
MKMEGSVMRMRSVVGIEIGAGETVALRPGGYHLMLVNLKHPLGEGEDVPLTLTFEKAGSLDVVVKVEAMGAGAPTR